MLVMVIVKIVFNIVPLLSFALLPCILVTLRFVVLRNCHPDGTEGSLSLFFRCFAPLQHDRCWSSSSSLFVILCTCHPDGTEGSLHLFLDASLRSSMTGAGHRHPSCLSSFVLVILTERKDLYISF